MEAIRRIHGRDNALGRLIRLGSARLPFCITSATVVDSKRCSTLAVFELSVVPRRTSSSCPAGTTPYRVLLTSVGVVFAVVLGVLDVGGV